ncbi:uncharacterized protein LOC18441240 [Amborella trichopoda]|uniref:uncharacterized protein LOC18441240 n=1 Tax=Amborella trichopoda TaxID=13333 RepID=UPI0005D429F2|nr:uncharacterized protein LOC18441240 [Amborella trichopoda]|eukprot:XP_011625926.1 uncharacterized protein LOC18441240 [Amborella trichopoda]
MQTLKWKSGLLLNLNVSVAQSPPKDVSLFHATSASLAKWKSKWSFTEEKSTQPSSKDYIRYQIRQKRSDAKKALRDLLFKGTSSKLQNGNLWGGADICKGPRISNKQTQSKKSARGKFQHSSKHAQKNKQKQRVADFTEESDERAEPNFHATFGGRCFTWSFKAWQESRFQDSTWGFEWRDPNWSRNTRRFVEDSDSDEDSCVVGSYSDRITLGLPSSGPLKIEDVKNAFRASALKWHPDKHQGPSQVTFVKVSSLIL